MLEAQEDAEDEFADDSGAVGVSFGAGDGDNDDEDSSDGESIEHHELARRESAVVGDYQDSGVGAFDSFIDQALPEIHEDVTYREEQERIMEEIEHDQHESENKGGLLSYARRASSQ